MKDKLTLAGKTVVDLTKLVDPAAALVGSFFFNALSYRSTQRVEKFLADVEARLKALETTGILEINDLIKKESFLDILLTACAVAHRTQRKEKLERIRNAVVYVGRTQADSSGVDAVLHLVDQLTEEHFVVLSVLEKHLQEFVAAESFVGLFECFTKHHEQMSMDAFGHYLYDLKFRRLVRISDSIFDEDGLHAVVRFASENDKDGPKIVITDVAKQLLEVTSS